MAQDPALAFGSNLLDRFMQFKGMQMQLEFQQRREARYERQLLEQSRRFDISQKGIAERHEETMEYRDRTAKRLEDMADSLKEYRDAQIDVMKNKKPFTEGRIEQTLGELESGGSTTLLGHVIPFRNREGYINHLLRRLGPDWLELAPEAAEIINRQFPEEEPIVVPKAFDSVTPAKGIFPSDETVFKQETDEQIRERLGITGYKPPSSEPIFLQGMREAQPKNPFEADTDFEADIAAAQKAMQEGRNPVEIYRRMREKYPDKPENELYRIYQF